MSRLGEQPTKELVSCFISLFHFFPAVLCLLTMCVCLLLQYGFNLVFAHKQAINSIALSLNHKSYRCVVQDLTSNSPVITKFGTNNDCLAGYIWSENWSFKACFPSSGPWCILPPVDKFSTVHRFWKCHIPFLYASELGFLRIYVDKKFSYY